MIDVEKFLFIYQEREFKLLNDMQRQGLLNILSLINKDDQLINTQQIAYCLATIFHECAGTWQPIAEYGKGKGREYGEPDIKTRQVYYGRGFVQLTWKHNYETMGKVLDIDLLNHPDLALKLDVAYNILSIGMRKGIFTGVGLSKYINGKECDYLRARKIINGMDCADKIAGYAIKFETILNESKL